MYAIRSAASSQSSRKFFPKSVPSTTLPSTLQSAVAKAEAMAPRQTWRELLGEWLLGNTTPSGLHQVPSFLRNKLQNQVRRLANQALLTHAEDCAELIREVSEGKSFVLCSRARQDLKPLQPDANATSSSTERPEDEPLEQIARCCAVLASLPDVGWKRPGFTGSEVRWWICGNHILLYLLPDQNDGSHVRILRVLDSEQLLESMLPSRNVSVAAS